MNAIVLSQHVIVRIWTAMGLGKTVMLMGLILKQKAEYAQKNDTGAKGPSTTLVVAKLSLLSQWEDEIRSKTTLSHYVYYGGAGGSKNPTIQELENVDVVITTYGTIQGELKRRNAVLSKMNWLRVILDEAHCVKNIQTLASKVCCSLEAKHRWCVSGTIIQNSLGKWFSSQQLPPESSSPPHVLFVEEVLGLIITFLHTCQLISFSLLLYSHAFFFAGFTTIFRRCFWDYEISASRAMVPSSVLENSHYQTIDESRG
jgi:SNF2 family DNA or RNA helicase